MNTSGAEKIGDRMGLREADLSWLDLAACGDLEISDFFVSAGSSVAPDVAAVCETCPAWRDCLLHALNHNITNGYFGGLSPGERKRIVEQRPDLVAVYDRIPGPSDIRDELRGNATPDVDATPTLFDD